MDKPNDIDYGLVDARLEGLSTMYMAAVHAYREGVIEALCQFTREFMPSRVVAVRLSADVDWRWCFEAFVDAAGEEVDPEFGDDFYFEDLFGPGILSELDDLGPRASYGYVYVADRVFSVLDPAARAEQAVQS